MTGRADTDRAEHPGDVDAETARRRYETLLETIRDGVCQLDADRAGREWVISVADEGIRIDPADQDRVFAVFDRLHSHEEYDGTGMGLALVERHGGDIRVESTPGEGSTFTFTLSVDDV